LHPQPPPDPKVYIELLSGKSNSDLGEVPNRAVGVKYYTNYTTAMHIPFHNFRVTIFVDKSGDQPDLQTLVLLYNELEE
jgi:hypothetical protein